MIVPYYSDFKVATVYIQRYNIDIIFSNNEDRVFYKFMPALQA